MPPTPAQWRLKKLFWILERSEVMLKDTLLRGLVEESADGYGVVAQGE